ncbi:hypothetical protein [Streptomyces sp. NPDC002763]|uniref:hypothetical protein n=1 Tax=Streptomyces sp. NPDC002763 TaxID=3154427 RepID=UPI00333433D1
MPADEVTHGSDVDASRVRTGPRHAAPKKPLFTRFHMPAGKAIASVAMPTAVIMGMGFTSTLAIADTNNTTSSSKSLAEDYKDCVSALDSASPSASASGDSTDSATPSPTASDDAKDSKSSSDSGKDSGKSSSSDSGSDDTATPTPSASKSSSSSDDSGSSGSDGTATPSPSASASSGSGGLLDSIGDAITGILGGGSTTSSSSSDSTASATPSPSASASADSSSSDSASSSSKDSGSDTVSKTVKKVTDTVKDTTDTATKAADEVTKEATKAADDATASPSPSASSSTSADDCKVATDDVSGVDNKVAVADDPWYLSASSLLLKSADYQGVVEVKTASGKTKKVLKYVISGGTDIGDLHQTVKDTNIGKTYHVQASSGSTSTIRDGDTTMYTESISGNLFGLIPITFTPDSPPPLNIPLIYFTNVKVVQAAQFGGTLHVPGMHVYTTDGTG